jgi:hypothetical protein
MQSATSNQVATPERPALLAAMLLALEPVPAAARVEVAMPVAEAVRLEEAAAQEDATALMASLQPAASARVRLSACPDSAPRFSMRA